MFVGVRIFGDRFRVEHVIESTGSVTTYDGWDEEQQQRVVLKVASGMARDRQLRLVYEAELLSQLESPHIVGLLAAGRDGDDYYVAMPRAGSHTLAERLTKGPLSVAEALTVGIGVLRALEAVHSLGLFHRDLKPENILLDEPLTKAVLIDFGLATEAGPAGSMAYMAPERLGLLDRPADERSDLYEAGLVLYEALAGRPPFQSPDLSAFLRAQMSQPPPSLRHPREEIPPALDALVRRLLEIDPARRYQRARTAAHDLEELRAGRTPNVGDTDVRRHFAEPCLTGREQELATLEGQLRESMAGQVRLVRLAGASGSGKTRLLQEFSRIAQALGVRVLTGRAQHRTALLPFGQLDAVFRPLAVELAQQEELKEKLRPWGEVLAIALESLRAVYPLAETVEDFQPQIARSARRVLSSFPGATAILLDDCQWSDEAIFDLLEECLGRQDPLLVVVAYRDELAEEHRLRSYQDSALLELSALSKPVTRKLLESMAGSLPEEVVEWVWAASGGDPFMSVSSLHGLLENRVLTTGESGWRLADEVDLTARVSLRGGLMLAQRLSLLSPNARSVLEAGALMGRQFEPPVIVSTTGLASALVGEALEEARRRHLIWRSQDGLSYVFAHDRVREVTLEHVSTASAAISHRLIAEHFVKVSPLRVYEIAYHFHRAGAVDEALPYALKAADMAMRAHSLQVAEEQYRIAVAGLFGADKEVCFQTFMGLGRVLSSRGVYQDAESYFLRARAHGADVLDQVYIESQLTFMYGTTDPKACREACNRGLVLLGSSLPRRRLLAIGQELFKLAAPFRKVAPSTDAQREADALGKLCQGFGTGAMADSDLLQALWMMLHGARRLRELPLSRFYGAVLANIGVVLAFAGQAPWGMKLADAGMEKALEHGDRLGIGQVMSRRQGPLIALGEFQETVEKYPELAGFLEPTGDAWETAAARGYAGLAFYYRGHLRTAFEMGLESQREALREPDVLHYAASARLCALAGLGYRSKPLPETKEPMLLAFHHFADGVAYLYEGLPGQAVLAMAKLPEAPPMGFHTAPFWAWLVTAYRQAAEALPPEETPRSRELLRKARKLVGKALSEGKRHTVSYPHALRESAMLAAQRGDGARARKQFDRALVVARRHQMDYELAWSLVERGRIGMALGWEDAERDLGQGRSLLGRIGAWLPGEKPQEEPGPVLSVLDRFSKVLESGRRIAAALDAGEIRRLLAEAALGLLRCQDCRVLEAGNLPAGDYSSELVAEALQTGRTVLREEGLPADLSESLLLSGVRSALCAPVLVHGQTECLLYVTHQQVGHLFGEEERRIGDYLASLAGAALENARNFQERQKANERFETLFRWTGVGTAVVSQEGFISDANPFFVQMLGISSEGLLLDAIYHADRTLVEEGWRRLFEDGQPLRLEVRCLRSSGELLWAQMTASRPPGEALAIAAFSDVSDRRLTQVAAFQESERRLLAAELHDGISQPLAALYVHLQTAALGARGDQADHLKGCVQQAKSLVTEISQLMFDLRNPTTGEVDAVQAVAELAQGFSSQTGIEVETRVSGRQVQGLAGSFLFRLVQEALTNVRKHSRASSVQILIEVTESEVAGQILDNGQGFDPSQVQSRATRHFGLKGMKERAELLGGTWALAASPGKGTRIEFRLPLG